MRRIRGLGGIASHSGANLLSAVIPVAQIPLLTNALGASNYGELATVQLISAALMAPIDLGMSNAAPRYLSVILPHERRASFATFSLVHFCSWIFVTACVYILLSLIGKFDTGDFMLAQLCVLLAYLPAPYLLIAEGLQAALAVTLLITRVTHLACCYLYYQKHTDPTFYFASNVCLQMCASIVLFLLVKVRLPRSSTKVYWPGEIIKQAFHYFAARSATSFTSFVIPIILRNLSGAESVAYYSLAEKMRSFNWQMLSPVQAFLLAKGTLFSAEKSSRWLLGIVAISSITCALLLVFESAAFAWLGINPVQEARYAWSLGAVSLITSALFINELGYRVASSGVSSRAIAPLWIISISVLVAGLWSINMLGAPAAICCVMAIEILGTIALRRMQANSAKRQ